MAKNVRTILLLFLLICCAGLPQVFSQMYSASSYLSDSNGVAIRPAKNTDGVVGNPFLSEDWCLGKVENREGKQLEVQQMRFNILQNRIEYVFNNQIYELAVPYSKFTIQHPNGDGTISARSFRCGFPPSEGQDLRTFYEVVYDGNVKLLKFHKVIASEYAEPLSVTRTRRLRKVSSLYVFHPKNASLTSVSKLRINEIPALFDDKKDRVGAFVKENRFKKKPTQGDLLKICLYYDGLQ